MRLKFQNVAGMPDILPKDRKYYEAIERAAFRIASYYGYQRIETPILENAELFEKGTGASTDIVQKQMYTLSTKGGDKLTLRPELTPSIVRAYIQHGMAHWVQPVKVSALGRVFRHERPQSGRFREFRQFELDAIGAQESVVDAQVIFLFFEILRKAGIKELTIKVNSIGCPKCRSGYKKSLRDYYRGRERSLCRECRSRKKINVLRLLDCKDEKCERLKMGAPEIVDYLCSECRNHFKSLLEMLDSLELPFVLSSRLVRGLDYYTKTVFEIFPMRLSGGESRTPREESKKEVGSQEIEGENGEESKNSDPFTGAREEARKTALVGGGRFDGLVKLLGGEETPAVGASLGMERVVAHLKEIGAKIPEEKGARVFFIQLGDLAKRRGLKIIEDLRLSGIAVRESLGRSSIRSQLSIADKLGVDYSLILGHQEVAEDSIIIRDMSSGAQERMPIVKLIKELKKRLKK